MIKNRKLIFSGLGIFLVLAITYFIKLNVDDGQNYITVERILGIIIFHNPFVLAIYILVAIILIVKGFIKNR